MKLLNKVYFDFAHEGVKNRPDTIGTEVGAISRYLTLVDEYLKATEARKNKKDFNVYSGGYHEPTIIP